MSYEAVVCHNSGKGLLRPLMILRQYGSYLENRDGARLLGISISECALTE